MMLWKNPFNSSVDQTIALYSSPTVTNFCLTNSCPPRTFSFIFPNSFSNREVACESQTVNQTPVKLVIS